jgi:hypothetical protein
MSSKTRTTLLLLSFSLIKEDSRGLEVEEGDSCLLQKEEMWEMEVERVSTLDGQS